MAERTLAQALVEEVDGVRKSILNLLVEESVSVEAAQLGRNVLLAVLVPLIHEFPEVKDLAVKEAEKERVRRG